ncbi:basic proline-rich protein [Gracilaria domingensis]|nr:basic proline-rich protein [Gracilaria domingensis]KAI0559854.1 basic proline-rich protein [Gracilaria domingensis]
MGGDEVVERGDVAEGGVEVRHVGAVDCGGRGLGVRGVLAEDEDGRRRRATWAGDVGGRGGDAGRAAGGAANTT